MSSRAKDMARIFILIFLASSYVFAADDPNTLFQQAVTLENEKKFPEALAIYNQIMVEFPDDYFAGPDKAAFRAKLVSCRMALDDGDIVVARGIAEEIKAIPSSVEQKPGQLYWTAHLLEKKKLFADAQAFYQQVITQFPNDSHAGPDYAGFGVKLTACRQALTNYNMVAVRRLTDEIKALSPSSAEVKARQLCRTAGTLESKSLLRAVIDRQTAEEMFTISESFYREVVQSYPQSMYYDEASMHVDAIRVLRMIYDGADVTRIRNLIEEIKQKYAVSRELSGALYAIGEAYFVVGVNHNRKDFLQESLNLFKNDIPNANPKANNVYYLLGLNYQQLGNYAQAIANYQTYLEKRPNFIYECELLFQIVRCYDELVNMNELSVADVRPEIQAVYEKLAAKYPTSKETQKTRLWLDEHVTN